MFNNPYLYTAPSFGIRGFLRGINWSNMLTNTSKTLNVINQAIPIVSQFKPIMNNAKTIYTIAGAINSNDHIQEEKINNNTNNGPIFFI